MEAEGQRERDIGRFYADGFEGGRRSRDPKEVGDLRKSEEARE